MVPNTNGERIILEKVYNRFWSLEAELVHWAMGPSTSSKPIRSKNNVLKKSHAKKTVFGLRMRNPNLGGVKPGVRSMELSCIGRGRIIDVLMAASTIFKAVFFMFDVFFKIKKVYHITP